jgi:uncharacterized SAM-binding protein YcdF (DUF218 family)
MRFLLRTTTAIGAAAVLLWLLTVGLVLLAGAWPQLRGADAILVLGAAQYNGRPSPVFRARLDHALELYHDGLAPHMVFTGGVGVGDTISEGEVGRRYALARGVPDRAILVDRRGMTSAQSVGAAAELMQEQGLRSALVVSDPFHMLRLEVLARRAGLRPYRAPVARTEFAPGGRLRWRYVVRESLLFPAAVVVGGR